MGGKWLQRQMEINWKQYSVYGESTLKVWLFMNVLEYKYWVLPVMSTSDEYNCVLVYNEYECIGPNPVNYIHLLLILHGKDANRFTVPNIGDPFHIQIKVACHYSRI